MALRQRHLDELERRFLAVSDPASEEYLDFMTAADIQALVSPPAEEKEPVYAWLHSISPAPVVLDFGDSLEVRTTVAGASALLATEFHRFTHAESGKSVVRAWGDLSLPEDVRTRVHTLFGVTDFPVMRYSAHWRSVDGAHVEVAPGQPPVVVENDAIVPQTVQSMYRTPSNQSMKGDSGVGLGVIEWGESQSFSPQDLEWFCGNTSMPGCPPVPAKQIVGDNNPDTPGGEASLDIQVRAAAEYTATRIALQCAAHKAAVLPRRPLP